MDVQLPVYLEVSAIIIAATGVYIAFKDLIFKKGRSFLSDAKDEKTNAVDMERRVSVLEGMIETQYSELKTKVQAIEKSISDNRANNILFENRIISSMDKLESKMESTRDLIIKIITAENAKGNRT